MMTRCAECGAVWADDRTCETVYQAFLALEFSDPGYGAVHFLTVATFMLQHGRYSEAALDWVVPAMRAYLAGETDVPELRRGARSLTQGVRDWKVTRQPGEFRQRAVAWDHILADVAPHAASAAAYCAAVTLWASRALEQWTETA